MEFNEGGEEELSEKEIEEVLREPEEEVEEPIRKRDSLSMKIGTLVKKLGISPGVPDPNSFIFEFEREYYLLTSSGRDSWTGVRGRVDVASCFGNTTVYSEVSKQVAARVMGDWYRRNREVAEQIRSANEREVPTHKGV